MTFTLRPYNDGPTAALAGWSVTDVLPAGMSLVSMSGTGYACDVATATCTADATLAAGAEGEPITVTATISALNGDLKNVAYVSPAADDVAETNPLEVPTTATDTAASATDNDAEAPLLVTETLVSIGDYVWFDVNRDGVQDAGEAPAPGVTVNLLDASGAVVATAVTDADGFYSFADLPISTDYTVEVVAPSGTSFTGQDAGGDDAVDSDVDPVTGQVGVTTPATGNNQTGTGSTDEDNPTLDAGLVEYNLVLAKKLDTAGVVKTGDSVSFTLTPSNEGPTAALAGWSVTDVLPVGLSLVSMSGAGYACDVATATCTADAVLAAGAVGEPITVTATITALNGDLKNVAYVSPSGDDVAETNPLEVPTTATDTAGSVTDNDAEVPLLVTETLVSIGDYVWFDVNRDGVQGAGEAPAPGVTVNLLDASGAVVATAVTDADGFYSFADLPISTDYTVEVVAPSGTSFTGQDAGGDDTVDSDVDPVTGQVGVTTPATGENLSGAGAPDEDNPTLDAGLVEYNLVLAKKLETAGPFKPGDTVTYTLSPSNEGPVDSLPGWSVTDVLPGGLSLVSMSGSGYSCDVATGTCAADSGLAAGEAGAPITVTATISAMTLGALKNVAYVSPAAGDVAETNPLEVPTTATDTAASPTDNDAEGVLELKPVSIGDYVWFDVNRDGVQGAGEAPAPGVTVNLLDASGAVVATTVTDGSGFYSFVDLLPGVDYTVEVVAPTGTSFTGQDAGGDDTLDSDVDPATGQVGVTTPGAGSNQTGTGSPDEDDPTFDAGLVQYNLLITKTLDTTGVVYSGQAVTFTLTPSNAGPVDALAGWSVTEVLPAGLTLVSMSGTGYTCDVATATCTADAALAAGAEGGPITVTATVGASFAGATKNVAYVSPSPDDVVEINPLVVPTTDTDTAASGTDNDAEAPLTVVAPAPAIEVVKKDTKGHDANTSADAVVLTKPTQSLVFTVTNTGNEDLTNVVVADEVNYGGQVTDLVCVFLDGSQGTEWAGPFVVGDSFECTATLKLSAGKHKDTVSVSGVGLQSQLPVTDDDPYYAVHKPNKGPGGTNGGGPNGGGTGGSGGGNGDPNGGGAPLPGTGSPIGPWAIGGVAALLLGGAGLILAGRRRRNRSGAHAA